MTNKYSPKMATDDFKLINGIGPAIEQRLHEAGILTFAQLAAMSAAEIASLVSDIAGKSAEYIAQQNWSDQARELAPELAPVEPHPEITSLGDRQHYATFTVELLLDEDSHVRRTRVVHVQGRDEQIWAGWEATRLVQFIIQQAALRTQLDEPMLLSMPTAEPTPSPVVTTEPVPLASVRNDLAGQPHLRNLEIVPAGVDRSHSVLRCGHPFEVRLTLDLTELVVPGNTPLNYIAIISVKNLSDGSRQTVGEAQGTIAVIDSTPISVPGEILSPGIYRLEAAIALTLMPEEPDFTALLEGNLFQIH